MAEMSPLRRRMIEDMTIRNLSPATQQSYIHAVSKFSRHFGHSPDRLGLEDVRAYQVHLISKGVSWASLNQVVCALRFFYGVTLGCDSIPERIAYAREPRKLPAVLSADEVVRFLEAVSSLKARIALTTAYAAGLRVSEVTGLKAADIDSERMVIRVECGKGGKERYVMLSGQLLGILRSYWRLAQPGRFLFPGRDKQRPIEPTVLHAACRSARVAAGIDKRVSVHVLAPQLRHPSPGERRRHSHHPGLARPRESVDDGALHARLVAGDRPDREPAGSAVASGDAAGIGGEGSAGVRTGRRLPPPR
jgi:site-specific recombinase XerD